MNISTRWLREWVSPDVSDIELSEKLTMAGLEVDQIAPVAPPFHGLVAFRPSLQATVIIGGTIITKRHVPLLPLQQSRFFFVRSPRKADIIQ